MWEGNTQIEKSAELQKLYPSVMVSCEKEKRGLVVSEVSKACEGKKCLGLEGGFQCYLRMGSFYCY